MLSQAKLYIAWAIALLVLALSGTVYVQGLRIDKLKAANRALERDKGICLEANKADQETIAALQRDVTRGIQSCAKQTETKNATIARLRDIIGAGGNHGNTSGTAEDQVVGVGAAHPHGNPVLELLDSMLPGPSGGREAGVHPPTGAPAGLGAGVPAGIVVNLYCLDEMNAKALAADFALCRGWGLGNQAKLASYQTGTGE